MYDTADPVALLDCPDYEPTRLEAAFVEGFELLGGLGRFIRPGDRVLLKPNLLVAAQPHKAITTHPEIVATAIRLVRDHGAKPIVGDSPSFGSDRRISELSGIGEVCRRLETPFVFFKERVEVQGVEGGTFRRFQVAREALEADRIINLAKAKTHQMLTLTLGVKNLFGCVVGYDKPRWHLRAGRNVTMLGRMIAELALVIDADLTILDAVLGMDGNGPSNGRPREFGFLGMSANPFALDFVVSHLFGLPAGRIPTISAGIELGASPASMKDIEVLGADPKSLAVKDFEPPDAQRAALRIPGFIYRLLKRLFTPKVSINQAKCAVCNACVEICPTGAAQNKGSTVVISRKDCISCYCCAEVCPYDAIDIH